MLRRRRAAAQTAQRDGAPTDLSGEVLAGGNAQDEPLAGRLEVEPPETRTLETLCVCGHTRRDHTGLRIALNGRCLECDCAAFTVPGPPTQSDAEILARMRTAIARVERLQKLALDLSAARQAASDGRAPR